MLALFESPESWILVAIILIFVFGASKLPELARSLGRSRSEFQKGLQEGAKDQPEKDQPEKDQPEPTPSNGSKSGPPD